MTKANECTCPSGDGSLRHPCPAHPAAEQAGGDERAAFELFVRKHCGMPAHIAVNWDAKFTNDAWAGWQARAALAQPSPAQTQPSPAPTLRAAIDVANDRFEVPVAKWGTDLAGKEERPEVVAWRYGFSGGIVSDKACLDEWKSGGEYQSLMTVAQHERIVKAWIERWKAYIELSAKIAAQRDAALAEEAQALREEVAALRARVVVTPDASTVYAALDARERLFTSPENIQVALEAQSRLNGKTVSEGLLRRLARPADRYDEVFTLDRHEAAEELRALLSEQEGGKQ
ncbi:hypothetical protein ACF0C0_33195 [Pseudomonas aeruginosa]|uniref:hypothetical protein n=1 Tax=Pseudomonas aeruginosa TaxID=287 RepID=UPI000EB31C8F|nr:hypothetical protein [Pseudomonas aeruginosa]HCF5866102.1 hypothetical protein [Pseudomonas aeruginosa]